MGYISGFGQNVFLTRDPIITGLIADSIPGILNIRFKLVVFSESFLNEKTSPLFWNYGTGELDISSYVEAHFGNFNDDVLEHRIDAMHYTNRLRRFALTGQEYAGSPIDVVGGVFSSADDQWRYALEGGNRSDITSTSVLQPDFHTKGSGVPCKFLTDRRERTTRKNQQQFLSFLYYDPSFITSDFNLSLNVVFEDGTNVTSTPGTSITGGVIWEMEHFRIPVGYSELGIQSIANTAGKTVWYYEVKIIAGGTDITETQRFYMDYWSYSTSRTLIYRNSRGGEDSVIFNGLEKFKSEVTSKTIDRYTGPGRNPYLGQRAVINKAEQNSVRTGTWLDSKEEADLLRDLLLSDQILEDVGDHFVPVEIIPGTFVIWDDEKSGYNLEFEYKYLQKNRGYTK